MYLQHFRLTEPPFSLTPDPRFLYMSGRHREALAHLLFGIGSGGGFVQLTGEVGTGKTSVCRCLLEQLPPKVDVALILNPRLTAVELLATVCDELHVAYPAGTASLKVLVDALHRHLLDAHARGRRTVVVIDEAQDLAPDVLEEVRLLTNLETTKEKLLQIVLIGQPELVRLLDRPELRQVAQRVTARYHLAPLASFETRRYVRHRLRVAGTREDLFTPGALRAVHRTSGGVPRLVNLVCDRALLGAYVQERDRVDARTVRRAAAEVFGTSPGLRRRGAWWRAAAVATVAAGAAGALLLWAPGVLERRAGGARPATAPTPARDAGPASPAPATLASSSGQPASRADGVAPAPVRTAAPTLADRLGDPATPASKGDAFARLYARWGLTYRDGENGCDERRLGGLQCLFRVGTWTKLRRFNVPAILELTSPAGERRYATLVTLRATDAALDVGGTTVDYPLAEIERHWEGSFIVLWRPPGPIPIQPGVRGRQVEWVRAHLARIDGDRAAPASPDLYDEPLARRVVAFQRAQALNADGRVGVETALQLAAAAGEAGVPWLSTPGR
jgi:general secretion pathway protein A